jgi:transposase
MDLARFVVEAVTLEHRSCREVAAAYGVSKSWVAELVRRYRSGGEEALVPRSRAPNRIPHRTPPEVEDRMVSLRKDLADEGLDAGAETIRYHLERFQGTAPSVTTIWRVLRRRGFVTPQPHKRPRSSWVRFEASLPNECWQSDVTHWRLADGDEIEIVNVIDDYSRLCVASRAFGVVTRRTADQRPRLS